MQDQKSEPGPAIADKVIKNTAYNTAGRFWAILVGVFLTPYIISHVGIERYAVWSLAGVITGYFSLFDFGIGISFVKYMAEFFARKEYERVNQIISTGFVFYSLLGAFILGISLVCINPLIGLFKVPAGLYQEAVFVFLVGIAIFVSSNAVSPFAAVQSGLQRQDITNKISFLLSAVNILGTILAMEKGWGLRGLILNNALVLLIHGVINIIVASRLLPGFSFSAAYCSLSVFGKLFKFGYRIQIARLSAVVNTQTDKVLIAYFFSLAWVTFYQLGSAIIYQVMTIPSLLINALIPAFSEIEAKGERAKLVEAYLRSTKYMIFFVLPLFVFLIVAAPTLMLAWMGKGFENSVLIIRILSAAWVMNAIAQVAGSVCIAIDKPQIMSSGSVIMVALNIVLSVILLKLFGFYGVAWGTLLAVNIGTIYYVARLHKELRLPFSRIIRVTLPAAWAGLFAGLFVYALSIAFAALGLITGRSNALVILFIQGIAYSGAYLAMIFYSKLFNAADIDFLGQKAPFMRGLLNKLYGK